MSKMRENYELALDRLILNKPTHPELINKKYKINKATVAIEAGRDPSSIRNDNPELEELRDNIKKAELARRIASNSPVQKDLKASITIKNDKYKELCALYEIALGQVNSLIIENKRLKDELKVYRKKDNILDFK
ncbi:hypothetical protein [Acinetobacter sp.]|uniref:hypothetical protein n=1 Tax=Acinetobacter sp. TaxID=472 RepID=UPI00241D9C6A|nr:hypothetical protein [Acinetobacter sp.]